MPDGGKLMIKTSTTSLDISEVDSLDGVDPGNFIIISITDNGIGMSDEVKEKIFEPSFTSKKSHQGSGLGLATVLEIIKQHNGHLTVESTFNQGTTFNLFFPVINADPAIDAPRIFSAPEIPGGHETILLVDDNDTARDFVCETLEYCGYKVLTASSGSEAIKVFHQTDYPIDLLITDIVMPGMNGQELARIVTKDHPETRIIFMSGYDDLSPKKELETLFPKKDFLKKPMPIDSLSRKVRKVLDR